MCRHRSTIFKSAKMARYFFEELESESIECLELLISNDPSTFVSAGPAEKAISTKGHTQYLLDRIPQFIVAVQSGLDPHTSGECRYKSYRSECIECLSIEGSSVCS